MKWFEMIHLRSTERELDQLLEAVGRLIDEVNEKKDTQVVNMYRSAGLNTDLSVHLIHNSERVANEGSQLGFCIAQELKPFGMVNHSVWIEIDKERRKNETIKRNSSSTL